MRLNEVLHSCSHGHVAEAAIVSIGGPFAHQVRSFAAAQGLSVGDFASHHVRRFSREASERDWRSVAARMRESELSLLAGFEAVMVRMMSDDSQSRAGSGRDGRAAA